MGTGTPSIKNEGEKITKEAMYQIYCFWANQNNKPILSKEQLGRRLNQKVKYLTSKTGKKKRFWENVCLDGIFKQKYNTLDTFKNIMRNYFDNENKDNENNIYKVKKSVVSVEKPLISFDWSPEDKERMRLALAKEKGVDPFKGTKGQGQKSLCNRDLSLYPCPKLSLNNGGLKKWF